MTTFHIVVLPVVLPQLCVVVCCHTCALTRLGCNADVNGNRAVLAWVVRLLVTDLPGPARPNIP